MGKQQLIIDGQEVELLQDLPASLTFQIADLNEPDKVKSDTSKTITIPASKKVNKLFSQIYDVNIDLNTGATFDPNVKVSGKYFIDNVRQFDGVAQLKAVNTMDGRAISYNIILLGRNANVFLDIGDSLLEDLDLSRFDHNWTQVNESDSWATQIQENATPTPFSLGNGYVYPMIDYGFDNDLSNFSVTELFPAIYAKTYLDQILLEAGGYTYNSSFLDSDNFKSLVVPYNRSEINITPAEVASRLWIAEGGVLFQEDMRSKNPGANVSFNVNPIDLNTTVLDPSGAVNLALNEVTIQAGKDGFYDVFCEVDIQGEWIPDTAGVDMLSNCFLSGNFLLLVNGVSGFGGALWQLEKSGTINTSALGARPATPPDNDYTRPGGPPNPNNPANVYRFSFASIPLVAGDVLTMQIQGSISLKDTGGPKREFTRLVGGANERGIIRMNVHASKLSCKINNTALVEGQLITHDTIIPRDVKQRDFFKGLVQMHNLYIEPDKDNPLLLNIEPRDDFYTDDKVDWSIKLDNSQDLIVKPIGALDSNEYLYTYKSDSDFYNTNYQDSTEEIYGQRKVTNLNEFYNKEKKNEIIFSPSPLVGSDINDRVIPRIFKLDNTNNPEPEDHNVRIMYYGGLLSTAQSWAHDSVLDPTTNNLLYPYAGHLDDPHNSTYDINFGLPLFVNFDPDNPITINGLFNTYHLNTINQITDINSKVVEGKFYLKPLDIEQLSFNVKYWFANSYWRLQKVVDYQPNSDTLTKCIFIKEV